MIKKNIFSWKLLRLCLLALFVILSIGPIIWILRVSLQEQVDAFRIPQTILFKPILDNYIRLFRTSRFPDRFLNSFIEVGGATILVLLIGVPGAYALSRLRYRFKNIILILVLSSRMIPPISLLIPYFIVYNALKFIDTRIGMIIAYTILNIGLVLWALWTFFDDIPRELDEAAEIDGANVFQTLYMVIIPISTPGIVSTTILCFVTVWNDFLFALVLTRSKAVTAPVELASKALAYQSTDITLTATGCIFVATPAIIFTFIIRKYLQKGLLAGAIKG